MIGSDSLEEFFKDSEVIDFKADWLKGCNLPNIEMFQCIKASSDSVTAYFTKTPSTDVVSIFRSQSGKYHIHSKNLNLPSSYMNNFLMVFVFIYCQRVYPFSKENKDFYKRFEEVYKSYANLELQFNKIFSERFNKGQKRL